MSKLPSFNKKLADYTKGISRNRTRFLPFVSTTTASLEKSRPTDNELKELKGYFRELVQYFPSGSELLGVLDQITPSFMFAKVYPLLETWLQTKLVESYLTLFGISDDKGKSPLSTEQALNFLRTIKQNPEYFETKKDEIKKAIEEKFPEQKYLSLFKDGPLQERFVSDTAIENFAKTITPLDLDLVSRITFLMSLRINNKVEVVLAKLTEILKQEASQDPRDFRFLLSDITKKFITKFEREINSIQDKALIQELSNSVITFYSQDGDWSHKAVYIKLMLILKKLQGNPTSNQLESEIRDFVNNSPFESWNPFDRTEIKELVTSFPNEFRNASTRDLRILPLGLSYLQDVEIPSLVSNLLDKARPLPPEQRVVYYEEVAKLKGANDVGLLNQFVADLVVIKEQLPDFVNSLSRKKFFSAEQRGQLQN